MEVLFRAFIYAEKYRMEIIGLFFAISFVMGVVIYAGCYGLHFWDTVSYSLGLFAMDVKTPSEIVDLAIPKKEINPYWYSIFIASTLAKFTVVLGVFLLFFRSVLATWYTKRVLSNGDHTIVVGLGRNSRFFINSMLEKEENEHRMIAFEIDKENEYLDQYKNERIAIVLDDVVNLMQELNLSKAKNIFISTGDDETNIYIAMKLMVLIDENNNSIEKFVVHIEDRTLRNLYGDEKVLHKENIDLRTFSFYKESARRLFKQHPVEGDDCEIIKSHTPFNILIVGNSELTISLISEACRLSNLPNENKLTIYCMGQGTKELEKNVLYAFSQIRELRDVEIKYIEADNRSLAFYQHDVWQTDNLTHIIYADNSVSENIRISTKVSEVVYVRDKSKILKTKFHIATMNHIQIAEEIKKEFKGKNVFTFAEADKICSRRNLLFNGTDEVAKMVHYAYESEHFRTHNTKITAEAVNSTWKGASVNDKRTSLAQVIHMNTKLKALGLKRKRVHKEVQLFKEKNLFGLYRKNIGILNSRLKEEMQLFGLTKKKLHEMEEAYKTRKNGIEKEYFFPNEYRTNFEKLVRMEHNRWMSILMLMDNVLDEKAKDMEREERKLKKVHHLLKPFEDFKTNEERIYVLNDIHTIRNMAKYLALTGYEIVDFDEELEPKKEQ